MHRGNPSLTGVVQASGLRHFQRVKWELEGQFAVHLPLVARHDLLYAIWEIGIHVEIQAIEQETGVIRWHWKPTQDEYAGHAHLYLQEDMLYYPVSTVQVHPDTNLAVFRGWFLYALDAQTGHVRRRISLPMIGNPNYNHFVLHEGVIYLNGRDDVPAPSPSAHFACAAVDLHTEQLLWRTDMGVRLSSTSPVVAQGMVYLQTYDWAPGHPPGRMTQHVHALDAQTGTLLWESGVQRGLESELAVAGDEVFVISNGLEVLDARSGTRKWQVPYGPSLHGPPTVTNAFVYLSYEGVRTWINHEPHQTGEMVVWERASRQRLWAAKANEGQFATDGAIVADDVLYAVWRHIDDATDDVTQATLFARDLRTGQEYWHFDATELSVPLVTDGTVFLVRGEGEGRSTFLCALT